ncbi:hypothetical protein V6767_20300 [Martelella sp. FLE1502]
MSNAEPHEHWRVAVEISGELIVSIETEMLAGRELSEQDEATVEAAARHLLGFIGRSPQTTEGQVKVKPLEWQIVIPDQVEWAFLPIIGKIQVEPYGDERWEVIWSMPGMCDKLLPDVFADIGSAKAAAQAYYESALKPVVTGTIQALEYKRGYLIACCNLMNLHHDAPIAADVLAQCGITQADVDAMDLTEYDATALTAIRVKGRNFDPIERLDRAEKGTGK